MVHVIRLSRQVPLVEQELFTLPEHLRSSVLFLLSIVLSVLFLLSIVLSVLVLLSIVLSVLFRITDTDYPFGIFNLFLHYLGTVHFNDKYIAYTM